MSTTINHQALEKEWLKPFQINEPRTLVIGSFNPFDKATNAIDYYYGRKSNYFWRTIATTIGKDEEYFFDDVEALERKIEVMKNKFCCLDVINSINFSSTDSKTIDKYIREDIFSNFTDQKIWLTSKRNGSIHLKRSYNTLIIDTLKESQSIKKVIHTMGDDRIKHNKSYPREINLKEEGFDYFVSNTKEICKQRKIEFIDKSLSPSAYAIRNGFTRKEELHD